MTQKMIGEDVMRPYEEAAERLVELREQGPPSFSSSLTYRKTPVFEAAGPRGESLLIAFGSIPLAHWLEVVNDYHADHVSDEPEPWDPADVDKVVNSLNRLFYERVEIAVEPVDDDPLMIEWGTRGMVPITTWLIKNR